MKLETLEQDHFYHVYNRGINGETLFKTDENMRYFLQLAAKHLMSEIYISAYCLMRNHFHLVIQVKEDGNKATRAFSNLFNAYAKAYNKQQNRTGSLFEKHFKRKRLEDEQQLKNLIIYVHTNPAHHQINSNYISYPFSSCPGYFLNKKDVLIAPVRKEIINLFCYVFSKKI